MTSPRVMVVVPTYNERDNLPLLARDVLACDGYRMLIVDDDSPDGTALLAGELGPEVRAIVRKGERGLATAVLLGIRSARHDLFVCMDADLSHPPEMVPDLCTASEQQRREKHQPAVAGSLTSTYERAAGAIVEYPTRSARSRGSCEFHSRLSLSRAVAYRGI